MWPYPSIIAHRGGGSLAPENTIAAFQCGFNCGFRAVEFDVMLTRDLIPVVIHDEQLGRTVAGQGRVSEMLVQELLQCDAGSWFGPEFSAVRVPTYREVLEFCTQQGLWMNVEIKPARGYELVTGQVVAELTQEFFRHVADPLPLFSSFSMPALAQAQASAPAIPRAALFAQIPDNWHEQLDRLQAVALHTNHLHLSLAQVRDIKQAGFGLSCYTVNEPARARELLGWGVDALFTDQLNLIPATFS